MKKKESQYYYNYHYRICLIIQRIMQYLARGLISTYWTRTAYSGPDRTSKMKRFGKIFIFFNYFWEILSLNIFFFLEGPEYVSGIKYS